VTPLRRVAKAVVAALVAAGGALGTAGANGEVTAVEWLGVIGTGVVAGIAVWRVPNRP
jgi:hypothetical protein